jgi:hypothetical protein
MKLQLFQLVSSDEKTYYSFIVNHGHVVYLNNVRRSKCALRYYLHEAKFYKLWYEKIYGIKAIIKPIKKLK